MNKMDEISYWISTKQAPCLYNYNNVIKKQCEAAHCSKSKSVQSILLETPKKKKKRKLSLLNDDSEASEKQKNVYFDTSQNRNQQTMQGCESDSTDSDLNFNIKSSSVQNKSKKAKKRSSRTTLHKKNKIVTSTPKVTGNLRRSLRRSQRSNTNNHLNSSFEEYNYELINGMNAEPYILEKEKMLPKVKKPSELFVSGDNNVYQQNCKQPSEVQQIKEHNEQFDDMSDVSGFTANYIRSTKMDASKKLRNVRVKGSRNFAKKSQMNAKKRVNRMLMCVNKSTGVPKTSLLNVSSDSSQNMINLITLKNDNVTRVSKSTSLLKFMDIKNINNKSLSSNQPDDKVTTSNNVNSSYQSKTSITSRYPKRFRNSSGEEISPAKYEKKSLQSKMTLDKRRKINKNTQEFNHSDRKENPEDNLISRTRSGKCIGLSLRQAENSVLVLSNSLEPVSSAASMNVATPTNTSQVLGKTRQRNISIKQTNNGKKKDKSGLQRNSVRDKSGFTACFSDSDEDNEHVKEKKFFC